VRFRLRNFSGFVPRVLGTAIIVEPQIDVTPDASGNISTSLWGNDNIDPGGASSPPSTFYTVEYWNQGRITSQANYSITGGAFDLDSATQLNPPPQPGGTGVAGILLETNGVKNGSQIKQNLVQGSGVTISDDGAGNITIGGGGGSAGSLSISSANAPGTVNLSTDGPIDWFLVTGQSLSNNQVDGKNQFIWKKFGGGFAQQNFSTIMVSGTPRLSVATGQATSGGPIAFSANAGDAATSSGVSTVVPPSAYSPYFLVNAAAVDFGWQFAVEANSTLRTMKVYLGGGAFSSVADITVTAHLMDGSAADQAVVISSTVSGTAGPGYVVTIQYKSANPTKLLVTALITRIQDPGFTAELTFLGAAIA
jgi:hypothetical protein